MLRRTVSLSAVVAALAVFVVGAILVVVSRPGDEAGHVTARGVQSSPAAVAKPTGEIEPTEDSEQDIFERVVPQGEGDTCFTRGMASVERPSSARIDAAVDDLVSRTGVNTGLAQPDMYVGTPEGLADARDGVLGTATDAPEVWILVEGAPGVEWAEEWTSLTSESGHIVWLRTGTLRPADCP